jgi:peptidoglycan hydrolase CwlO-like protein
LQANISDLEHSLSAKSSEVQRLQHQIESLGSAGGDKDKQVAELSANLSAKERELT